MNISTLRRRCFSYSAGNLIAQLISLSALSLLLLADSSEIPDNDEAEIELIEQYYFAHEIDFLAKQSMILGNYYLDDDDPAAAHANGDIGNSDITRLRFIEESLQVELDFIRRLKIMKEKEPDEILADIAAATDSTESPDDGTHSDKGDQKKINVLPQIVDAINDATWSTWTLPLSTTKTKNDVILLEDHTYDYDWIKRHGFSDLYANLDCYEHARNQNKPFYTLELWHTLWKTFQESTLGFPKDFADFSGKVYHVGRTKDGKGRGNFASANITKGSRVHSGYPNTVFFVDSNSWFRFLSELPVMLACDAMEWVWQQDFTDSGNVVLCLNLDEAVFFNDGGGEGKTNMELKEPTGLDFYANRDIEVGEELVYDYSQFEFDPLEMDI